MKDGSMKMLMILVGFAAVVGYEYWLLSSATTASPYVR